jgi:hypothetical protein
MTRGQTIATVLVVLIVAAACVGVAYINKDIAIKNAEVTAEVAVKNAETAAQINAQTEIERTKITEAEATQRTKERMNWIPWYEGGENKEVPK